MPTDLDSAKYVSFTTYKKNGSPVSLPVWVVPFEGGYAFTSNPNAFKILRIRRDARASLTVCDVRGKTISSAPTYQGAAVVLPEEETQRVNALIAQKYPIGMKMIHLGTLFKKAIGKGASTGTAAIKVTLSA